MQHFYDGQIRRYLTQTIRVFSNFVVKYADGTLHRVPVMYGDPDRQVASILRANSENKTNSVPRIAVYISELDIDKERLADSSFVSKLHVRERDIVDGAYTSTQGKNYTVERLMPTPFKLTMKVDIWSANADQKLQIMEQILVLFNPSLELQTNSNFIDWTALSVLNLNKITWSSRTVPTGKETENDIATLTVDTPIWISPPAKVKHLGVITQIITSMFAGGSVDSGGYVDGLGYDLGGGGVTLGELLDTNIVTIDGFDIEVYNGQAVLLGVNASSIPALAESNISGTVENWQVLFTQYPGKYFPASSKLYLIQPDGSEVSGTISLDDNDPTILNVDWDPATYPNSDFIGSYDHQTGRRANNQGADTFDAIIDPTKVYPGNGIEALVAGDRFLIIEDITIETDAWGTFAGKANDIIEWNGTEWTIAFDSIQDRNNHIYQTNIYNGIRVQYLWNGVQWKKSFEGDYKAGQWRIVL